MTATVTGGPRWSRPLAGVLALALAVLTTGCGIVGGGGGNNYSAMFRTAIGVYPNADVRILGVPVGKVDAVTPQGDLVRVDFHVASDIQVPAEVKAAVVAPTVVADRYVQLTPVYTGGPTLAEGAVIPRERTASPPEFDDLVAAAQKLSTSLGPEGVNRDGALSEALTTAANNLRGNGQQLNTTLDNTSQAINTLSASRDNLANTTKNLQSFTTNLKNNDAQVRQFTQQFAEVNRFLSDERGNLGETLRELSVALGDVANFVRDNRDKIKENTEQLASVLETVNNERLALEQVLETAPMGLDGLVNTYDAGTASLATRSDLLSVTLCLIASEVPEPLQPVFIELIERAFPNQGIPAQCAALSEFVDSLPAKSMLPSLGAQLKEPKVQAALGTLLANQLNSKKPLGLPAPPKTGFPLVAPKAEGGARSLLPPAPAANGEGGARSLLPPAPAANGDAGKPKLPAAPEEPKKAVDNLLGGGR